MASFTPTAPYFITRASVEAGRSRIGKLGAKITRHLTLLRRDPEVFARNLSQFTHPDLYESRLLNVLTQPPLHVTAQVGMAPALNILQPVLSPTGITGGPNTVLVLAALVAELGVPVRLITYKTADRQNGDWLSMHLTRVLGRTFSQALEVATASDPNAPASTGVNDLWLATHWTTAQALKPVLPRTRRNWFVYLIQDYEPGFYSWSSNHALALETYSMPFRALINENFLLSYLSAQRTGLFAMPDFVNNQAEVFEPAVDRSNFYPPPARTVGPHRLLFYGRPRNDRNMFGLGVHALRKALEMGGFTEDWDFISIGDPQLPKIRLARNRELVAAPWHDYAGYAGMLRSADLLLCLMLSPHTSYPVLEMAACGGLVLTNTFGPKSAEALRGISPDICGVTPGVDEIAVGLHKLSTEVTSGRTRKDNLICTDKWESALLNAAQWVSRLVGEP